MNSIRNAEEVLELLLTQISLGSYDKRFMYNLQLNNIIPRKPITTNQATLFKKVLLKYHKQFSKQELDVVVLAELPWSTKIIPSASEFTVPSIKIENDIIILRSPYKSQFISDFRALGLMQWSHSDKCYYADFGIRTLSQILDMVNKHYTELTCCEVVTQIVNDMTVFENCKYWNPTLVRANGNLYIAAINEQLHAALQQVELSTDWETIAKLTAFGVAIDSSLQKDIINDIPDDSTVPKLKFAAGISIEHDITQIDDLASLIQSVKCDYVLYLNPYRSIPAYSIEDMLINLGIEYDINTMRSVKETSVSKLLTRKFSMPIIIQVGTQNFAHSVGKFAAKIVALTDATPIKLD